MLGSNKKRQVQIFWLAVSLFRQFERGGSGCGTRFACGIVLADNDRILRVDDRMFAMPIKMLWEG